jgi:hypothetical protein
MADNTQNYLMIAAASAFVGGGGTHLATSDQQVNSVTIQDCAPFSQHAREHEQHKCQALINAIKLDCDK